MRHLREVQLCITLLPTTAATGHLNHRTHWVVQPNHPQFHAPVHCYKNPHTIDNMRIHQITTFVLNLRAPKIVLNLSPRTLLPQQLVRRNGLYTANILICFFRSYPTLCATQCPPFAQNRLLFQYLLESIGSQNVEQGP
jgi:hypothetical protein